eukprot:COSAG05_NODE_137_length_16843_cov_121.090779_26_plen_91_part_00
MDSHQYSRYSASHDGFGGRGGHRSLPAGSLTLAQNEKRRRDDDQLGVFYNINNLTKKRHGARSAWIDRVDPSLRSSMHGVLTFYPCMGLA